MICSIKTSANRKYIRRMLTAQLIYMGSLLACVYTLRHLHPAHPVTVVLAIIPAISLIAVIVVLGIYLKEEQDEFQRDLVIQALLWSTGITLASSSVWGFLEMFSDAPHIPLFYVFVFFWASFGFASGLIRLRYRGGPADE